MRIKSFKQIEYSIWKCNQTENQTLDFYPSIEHIRIGLFSRNPFKRISQTANLFNLTSAFTVFEKKSKMKSEVNYIKTYCFEY